MSKKIYLFFLCFLWAIASFGQHEKAITAAEQHIKDNYQKWELSQKDISDISVANILTSKHNGVTHIYFSQRYQGVKIFNALTTVNVLPSGEILHTGNRFLPNIEHLINSTQPKISPETAIQKAAQHLKIKAVPNLLNKTREGKSKLIFKNTNISNADIHVEPIYQLMDDGKLYLSWQLAIDMTETTNWWNLRVDAATGEVLSKDNWTRHCSLGMHNHSSNCGYLENANRTTTTTTTAVTNTDGSSYNVYALPVESPLHGDRSIVNEPAHPEASPFGWHDINGQPGPEFTITRGNNVHAYADLDGSNSSPGGEPDGGEELVFDFPVLEEEEPDINRDAATTQLFYMNNMMHDIFFTYGFDEQAGNFQETNYEFGAFNSDGDFVAAEAQDGFDFALENNPNFIGNANFATPQDGFNGRMQMFVWGRGGGRLLQVTAPSDAVASFEVGTANFGIPVDSLRGPIIGQAANVDDGTASGSLGCNAFINADEVNGKIALIDRGNCFFSEKATNARDAGAIAVIICNFEDALVQMAAGPNFQGPLNIPVLSLRRNDCQTIRTLIGDGLELKIETPPPTGPNFLDGDFDNGIVAHEYGHGISNRLTGGRGNSSCLFNDEEMGEGWSDYFTLVTSVRPGDTGAESRGIGNYVLRNEPNAQGLRSFPYSTDMSISPFTYRDLISTSTAPHPVGQVWTAMIWDLYWAMSDKLGFSSDLFNGDGGNHRAIQLVMDGMKIQPCRPGFIDGRNAILAADRANNNGENQCLIWEVFARRGLGFSATQGDRRDRNDGIEAFDLPPSCTNALTLTKTATETINAGNEIAYTLTLVNNKTEGVTNVVITDNLPDGLVFNTASMPATVNGGVIRFEVPTLASSASIEITYTATTDNDLASTRQFLDDMEEGDAFWLLLDEENTNLFSLQDSISNSGDNAWRVINPDELEDNSRQILQLDEEILVTGNQPVLRFFHQYNIDEGTAGGIVEISTNGGGTWTDLGPHFIRNGYNRALTFLTFATIDAEGFSGSNGDFEASYVDLSAFQGETVTIRFRFGSLEYDNDRIPDKFYAGWFVDDVEFMDLQSYQSQVCVTSAQGDNVCTEAEEGGTFVEVVGLNTSVQNLEELGLQFEVFPNPASNYLNISLSNNTVKEGSLSLYNLNGQTLVQQPVNINRSTQVIPLNIAEVAAGFYLVKIQTNEGIAVKKIIIE